MADSISSIMAKDHPLLVAISKGDLSLLKEIIVRQKTTNLVDEDGATPLEMALRAGQLKIAEILLASGALPTIPNGFGQTPLMVSAQMGQVNIAELLVVMGSSPDVGDKRGKTALMYAIIGGHLELAKLLIRQGADLEQADQEKRTALFYAVMCMDEKSLALLFSSEKERAQLEAVQKKFSSLDEYAQDLKKISQELLSHDVKIDILDSFGQGPIHYASKVGNRDILLMILGCGGDLHLKNESGQKAADLLTQIGKGELIPSLQKIFEKVHPGKGEEGPAENVIVNGKIEELPPLNIPKELAPATAEINKKNSQGHTPLMVLAKKGDLVRLRTMIEIGANIEIKDFHGKTVIFHAIKGRHLEITSLLAQIHKNLEIKDASGLTPMAEAVINDWPAGIRELLKYNASLKVNIKGVNLVMMAASQGAFNSLLELLKLGADPREKDFLGRDALFLVKSQLPKTAKHIKVEKILEKWLEDNPIK